VTSTIEESGLKRQENLQISPASLNHHRQNEFAALLVQAPAANITFLFWSTDLILNTGSHCARGQLVLACNDSRRT